MRSLLTDLIGVTAAVWLLAHITLEAARQHRRHPGR